jgi:hypothetical protein
MNDKDWRDIPDLSNYQINQYGEVRNRHTGKIKSQQIDKHTGYLKVHLYKNGKDHNRAVHQLLGEVFLNKPKGLDINHRDGNKLNNILSNLIPATRSENIQHAYDNGLNHRARPVKIIETGEVFPSVTACARAINHCHQNIFKCLDPNDTIHHSVKGYHFEFSTWEEYDNYRNRRDG